MTNLDQELKGHMELIRNCLANESSIPRNKVEDAVYRLIDLQTKSPASFTSSDIELIEGASIKYELLD